MAFEYQGNAAKVRDIMQLGVIATVTGSERCKMGKWGTYRTTWWLTWWKGNAQNQHSHVFGAHRPSYNDGLISKRPTCRSVMSFIVHLARSWKVKELKRLLERKHHHLRFLINTSIPNSWAHLRFFPMPNVPFRIYNSRERNQWVKAIQKPGWNLIINEGGTSVWRSG